MSKLDSIKTNRLLIRTLEMKDKDAFWGVIIIEKHRLWICCGHL